MASEDFPLASICTAWIAKITRALQFKKHEFQRHADEAMKFFDGDQGFMWDRTYREGDGGYMSPNGGIDPPTFRMTVMRVTELVQLMAPKLYPSNPYRSVTPRSYPMLSISAWGDPNDPHVQGMYQTLMQQEQFRQEQANNAGMCLEAALNYTPNELDLKGHSRRVIDECLIKGMGMWWTEVFQPHRNARKLVGSFQDSCDAVVFDPDAETFEDVTWVARRRYHTIWEVEARFNLPPGSLKGRGTHETADGTAEAMATRQGRHKRKHTKEARDMLEYWEIYSKQGFGDRSKGVNTATADAVSMFGDFCYIAVAKTVNYPLNMPNELLATGDPDLLFEASQWPIPFWADGKWPFTMLKFHGNPNSIYPLSHIKPAIGELRFLSWAMSFLATKIAASSNTLIGVQKSAAENVREGLLKSINGFNIIDMENTTGKKLSELIEIFNVPGVTADMWTIISAVNDQLEKRLGLSEILYGQTETQSRSASDAQTKQQNASIRVDDMYAQSRGALTDLARNEAFASRWIYTQNDLLPVIGPQCAAYWMQNLVPHDLEILAREFDFRIEAGNAREPSKEVRIEQANQSVQVLGPLFQQYMVMTGNTNPMNALIQAWGAAMEINTGNFMMPPAMPPQPQGPPGEPQGEGQQTKKPPMTRSKVAATRRR